MVSAGVGGLTGDERDCVSGALSRTGDWGGTRSHDRSVTPPGPARSKAALKTTS